MIAKERKIPIRIRMMEALLSRIPSNHPKRLKIEEDLAKRTAGFRGEESLDYFLHQLDPKYYTIFHDLRLPYHQHFFQIDTLLLSPMFALILEVKNIAGTLFFDQAFQQLIRTKENQEQGFPNPLTQVQIHKDKLKIWMASQQFPDLPLEGLVVISSSSTILKTSSGKTNIPHRICHSIHLLDRIQNLTNQYPYDSLDQKQLRRLTKLLIKSHVEPEINIVDSYNLTNSDLITGVQCPSCSSLPMIRKYGTWKCPICQIQSKDAHLKAITDYFLLGNKTLTNQQFCRFLHLSSSDIATRMLSSLNLQSTGKNKGRVYVAPNL